MANQDSKLINIGLGQKNSVASMTRIIFPSGVTKNMLTQIPINAREHSSMQVANGPKGGEAAQTGQTWWANRLDQFSRVLLELVDSRDSYHSYVVKDGELCEQTSKANQHAYVTMND